MFKYIYLLSILFITNSCVDKARFTNEFEEYKSDLSINSQFDEYDPVINGEYLYITAQYNINDRISKEILKSKLVNGKTTKIIVVQNFCGELIPTSTPAIYENNSTGLVEYYFSAKKCNKCDSDLYYTFALDTTFSPPVPIDIELNSEFEELQPRISNDGKKLLFVSNREDSFGETDIYYTEKDNNGIWKKPKNLGNKVNTSAVEDSPSFGSNNEIYFSSNGKSKSKNFNIYKADFIDVNSQIEKVNKLSSRINSKYNEKSYVMGTQGEIYYSSDRFGNSDIFSEAKCLEAFVSLNFINENDLKLNGKLTIKNDLNQELISDNITGNSVKYELAQDNTYFLDFKSDCYPQFNFEKEIFLPCDDIKNTEYNFDIIIPMVKKNKDIEEYNIPFFVTGYYYPNTIESLNNLKLLFKHNRFSADSTNYVEEPSDKYESYSVEIEAAFEDINDFLNQKVEQYNSACDLNDEYVKITIVGYADERKIASGMRYFGPSIIDNSIGLNITNGAQFNNLELSKLRAYFTAQEIQKRIQKNDNYKNISNRIIWDVKGKGESIKNNQNLDLARRVSVLIESKFD